MAVVFQFWGNQVGTINSVDDDGNGNTTYSIGEMPFLPTDRILITFTDESFDENGEFLASGDIVYTEVRVIRDGVTHTLSVNPGSKVKESGGGENKEQGDSFFQTNDTIGPAASGPFSNIPDDQYVFVTGTTLDTENPVTISRQSGVDGNSNFDIEHGLNNLICFARGTNIKTPRGQVPVERLKVGDNVMTLDCGVRPIRWISSRELSVVPARFHPIRIEAEAFGPGMPYLPLEVSPQHRVMLESSRAELYFGESQVLGAAGALVNDETIRQVRPRGGITYFHFCFDDHQIVFANGLPCESFFPGAQAVEALDEAPRAEILALFPELNDDAAQAGMLTARKVLRSYEASMLVA